MNQTPDNDQIKKQMLAIQSQICEGLESASGDKFKTENWDYQQGTGGGVTKVVVGSVLEKGGVNFSAVSGTMNKKIASRMKVNEGEKFFATGVSLVLHPYNPFVPTVHMNVRYFDIGRKWWFGGGIDLTPYYPDLSDIRGFHNKLKNVCDAHNLEYYRKFKKWCDEYFFIKHRGETRGVGGIFFDYLSTDKRKDFQFTTAVGESFNDCYVPILTGKKDTPFAEGQRDFQAYRRGRYVEFNLMYDRGTLFGIETKGRIESILMSLPPKAAWIYDYKPAADSPEAQIYKFLKPQEWI